MITHVDHVQPLYYDGKNIIENLVLSCKRCNLSKWINDRYIYPEWIKQNKVRYRQKRLLSAQKKLYKQLVEEHYQEELGLSLRWVSA